MAILLNLSEQPNFTQPGLLLHPQIPPALHRINPRTIRGKEWWDETRKEAFEKNNNCCWACGVYQLDALYHQWLEGHECYLYDWSSHRAYYLKTVGLCHACHMFIHPRQLLAKRSKDILLRGMGILKAANLPYPARQVRILCWLGGELDVNELLVGPPKMDLLAADWKLKI